MTSSTWLNSKYISAQRSDLISNYRILITLGNIALTEPETILTAVERMLQVLSNYLTCVDGSEISLFYIGVGPSNAKTVTDHIAVLRPYSWLMVGHCGGLLNSQRLGVYVLTHAYLREEGVLDDNLPVWVSIPELAEIHIALETALACDCVGGLFT